MKKLPVNCPFCDYTVREFDEYVRCGHCGVVRTRYMYCAAQYAASYAKNYLEYAETPINLPLNLCRLGLVSRWLKKTSKILDVGCCIGEFLRFAEKYYQCVGFEPNEEAVKASRDRIHSRVVRELPPISAGLYDCITMFDVVEHIEEPNEFISLLHELLSPGGVIAITTPNAKAAIGDDELRRWKHYKPREHLWLYTEKSLELLLKHESFHLIHVGYEESDIRPGNPNNDILTMVARRGP